MIISARHVEHSAKVGYFDDPSLNEELSKLLDIEVWLPIEWDFWDKSDDGLNGPPPVDPTVIYLDIDLGEDEDNRCVWSFSFNDLVMEMLSENGGMFITAGAEDNRVVPHRGLMRLRAGLKALVAKLDAEVEAGAGSGAFE